MSQNEQPAPGSVPGGLVLGSALLVLFVLPALSRLVSAGNAVAGALAALPFLMLLYVLVILMNRGRIATTRLTSASVPFAIWSVLLVVSMARSNNPSHAGFGRLMLAALWFSIIVASAFVAIDLARRSPRTINTVLIALASSAGVFVTVNLVLHLLGVTSSRSLLVDLPEGRLAALLGLRLERTLFPLASGINNFGTVAGLGVAGSLGLLLAPRISILARTISLALLASCISALILTDSRGPLFFGLVSGGAVPILFRTRFGRSVRWISMLAPALPVLLLLTMNLLASTDVGRLLSRQQGDIATATGRTLVWGAAVGKLVAQPAVGDVVGYGQYGPKGAGISVAWAVQFKGFMDDPTLISTHNFSLQLIYDLGYAGFICVLLLFWWALGRLEAANRLFTLSGAVPLASALVFILLAGTTEATLSIGFPEMLVLVSLTIALCAFLPSASKSGGPPQEIQ